MGEELNASLNISKKDIIRATGNDNELRGKPIARSKPYKAVLVNYNRLWFRYRSFSQYIQEMRNNGKKVVVIFDESHWAKGGRSFSSGVKRIAPFANHRVLLSGTPMPKEPADLVHQFRALIPYMMNEINSENATEITRGRFVRTTKGDQGLKEPVIILDNSTTFEMDPVQKELHELLRNFFAAQLKVGDNRKLLAEIIRLQRIMVFAIMVASNPVIINNKRFYEVIHSNPEIYEKIISAKKLLKVNDFGPKFRYVCNRARELAKEGKKVLIWTSFVENVALIADELEDLGAVFIRGDVPTEEGREDPFQNFKDASDEEEETREKRIHKFKTSDDCMVL